LARTAEGETLKIQVPPKLIPVFTAKGKRVRGSKGGRGSGKTRTFAKMAAVQGARFASEGKRGIIVCAREFMNSLDESSFAEVKEAIESDEWLSSQYDVGKNYIRTRDGKVEFVFCGLRHNLASIKSKALILLLWVDEAERVSETAWAIVFPTVRYEDMDYTAEVWVTWNPERKGSATDKRFGMPRELQDDDVIIVEMNYTDNPWFPAVLEKDRQRDLRDRPDQYEHIWEGGYATSAAGAYYAASLLAAKPRIGNVALDPLMTIFSHHDIGGRGAKADAYSIWISQRIGREIRVLDHYTSAGQPLSAHVNWMRQRGYGNAEIVLPHDGDNEGGPVESWASAWKAAGFKSVKVIPNQGQGAAMFRIEQVRRWFPRMWFNKDTTEEGRISLGMYAPKISKETGADLGPNHDLYSHDADAFGLMACDYREPMEMQERPRVTAMGTIA
jgi:phage terminase large subunit